MSDGGAVRRRRGTTASGGEILAIGLDSETARSIGQRFFAVLSDNVIEARISELVRERLESATAVFAPIIDSNGADAIDIAERLARSGFGGRLVLFTENEKAAEVVMDEVARVAPKLSFDIVPIGSAGRIRSA